MELNQRCVEILQSLRDSKNFIKITDLAKFYNVTDRTIRYNIDKIEKVLLKNGFSYLEKEHGRGIKLIKINNDLDEFIDTFVNKDMPYKYTFSPRERRFYIAIKLLLTKNHLNSEYFQHKLYISKNTVLKELDLLTKIFWERNLKLQKINKAGIWVEGNENDRRRAIIDLALQVLTIKDIFDYLKTQKVDSKIVNHFFEEIFTNLDPSFLDELIREAEKKLKRQFSDQAYCHLLIYLAIAVKRADVNVYNSDLKLDDMQHCREFEIAGHMVDRLNTKFVISIPAWERDYIMLYLLGAEIIKLGKKQNIPLLWGKLNTVAQKMVDEMEQLCKIAFGKEKRGIVEDLITFLRPAIFRIKYCLMQENWVSDEVKSKYGEIFVKAKIIARHLEKYIGYQVGDSEISYLTMLFVTAFEKVRQVGHSQTRVIIVCGAGMSTASMLALKLMNEFDVEVIDTVSCRELSGNDKNTYDLIVSTVDLPGYDQERYLKVNPLLGKDDYQKLQNFLNVRYSKNNDFELSLVNKLIGITEKYAVITDKQQLQYEMIYEIKNSMKNHKGRRFIYMLNDLLTWDTVKPNLACNDWKEAIAAGALLLEKKHLITIDYKKAIIENFNKFGPYMVVAPKIVLAHARPEDGVKQLSMSLITLKNPVEFGHDLNDPVKMVVTLAALDNDSHLEALSQLMELFMNHEDVTLILNATNKEEIIKIIQKYVNI